MRLLLAAGVIAGHAAEIVDGSRVREPVTRMFGSLSLGELCVEGFFLLNGWLVAGSLLRNPRPCAFAGRRLVRVLPGFYVAWLACGYALGPLVHVHYLTLGFEPILRVLAVDSPGYYPGALAGLPYPNLNVAMWTVAYELRCYGLVLVLGLTGLLARRRLVLAATLLAMLGYAAALNAGHTTLRWHQLGWNTLRLDAVFLVGVTGYLYRDRAALIDGRAAELAAAATVLSLVAVPAFGEVAVATLGAASVWWLAYRAPFGRLAAICGCDDPSYGLYLHGWPVSTAILWCWRGVNPVALTLATLPIAFMLGMLSWRFVERPMLRCVRSAIDARRGDPSPGRPSIERASQLALG